MNKWLQKEWVYWNTKKTTTMWMDMCLQFGTVFYTVGLVFLLFSLGKVIITTTIDLVIPGIVCVVIGVTLLGIYSYWSVKLNPKETKI